MAEASISVDQDQFNCPVCLDLLKDPVTISCGHSYCMVCINEHWDQEGQRRVYSCPQCREKFNPRPVLRRNNMLAEVVEKLKTEAQATSPAHCFAGPGDVECDFCTGRKRKATLSCLTCQASYCKTHLQPHYEIPALKRHKVIKVSKQLQEKICSQHDKLIEIYCRTDQTCICYLCTMDQHRGHDSITASAERIKKQPQLEQMLTDFQQRIQKKEKKLQDVKQAVKSLKSFAESAVEDSERIFTELISSIEKKRYEVTELIRAQEKTELSASEELLKQLEQEITDLKKRHTELEQLLQTEDHIFFLQSFHSVCVTSGCEDSPCITLYPHLSFDGVRKSLSNLKEHLEEFCRKAFIKISPQVAELRMILAEPKTREDFMQYFRHLSLDPNTVNHFLSLSENNRFAQNSRKVQPYSDHPERFDYWKQVLSKESVSGRCYWEAQWSSKGHEVSISVSYKGISRKGRDTECLFGHNNQSWSLQCFPSFSLWHNNTETKISAAPSSRIGVYVDHNAGTLSFYGVSDRMTLLHKVQNTFTQTLYAGFGIDSGSSVKLNDNDDMVFSGC